MKTRVGNQLCLLEAARWVGNAGRSRTLRNAQVSDEYALEVGTVVCVHARARSTWSRSSHRVRLPTTCWSAATSSAEACSRWISAAASRSRSDEPRRLLVHFLLAAARVNAASRGGIESWADGREEHSNERGAIPSEAGGRAAMHRLSRADDPAQELQRDRRRTRAGGIHAGRDARDRSRVAPPAGDRTAGQRHRPPPRARRRREPAVQRTPRHQPGHGRMDRRPLGRIGDRGVHLRHRCLEHEGGRCGVLLRGAHAGRSRSAAGGRRDPDLRRG